MIIGVPKEIKKAEFRVAAIPAGVKALCEAGHKVFVEKRAGEGSGFSDEEFIKGGAEIIKNRKKLFDEAEFILKVKEPLPEEYHLFHEGQILFTYLHLMRDGYSGETCHSLGNCQIPDKSSPSSCHFLVKAPLIFFEIPLGLS